jgi:hypothetical protein
MHQDLVQVMVVQEQQTILQEAVLLTLEVAEVEQTLKQKDLVDLVVVETVVKIQVLLQLQQQDQLILAVVAVVVMKMAQVLAVMVVQA